MQHYQNSDEIRQYSISQNCTVTPRYSYLDVADKLGPRLGVAQNAAATKSFAYNVVPNGAGNKVGHLQVQYVSHTDLNIQGGADITDLLLGPLYDSTGTPIAAATSNLPAVDSFVAVRKNATTLAVVFNVAGNYTERLSGALPNNSNIGNSIAIAPTSPIVNLVGTTIYESIIAPGDDGHVYETRILKDSMGTVSLDSWLDLGQPGNLDWTSDSVAAGSIWDNSNMSYDGVSIYVRTTANAAMMFEGSGWTNEGAGTFLGRQSVFQFLTMGVATHETYGFCTVNNASMVCRMTRAAGGMAAPVWSNIF